MLSTTLDGEPITAEEWEDFWTSHFPEGFDPVLTLTGQDEPRAMFSSKTLEDRNNDPKPWVAGGVYVDEYDEEARGREALGNPANGDRFDPRPEFQHGKLPANPILVEFRRNGKQNVLWRDLARDPSAVEKAHARRVLHLRSVVYA